MIVDLLQNKTGAEKARIKGQEIAKIKSVPRTNVKFSGADYDIEIVSFKAIESGVELYAKAWDANGQVGFGKDGTVDIERFVFINPPILIDDPNGTIVRPVNNGTAEMPRFGNPADFLPDRKLTENPKQAILNDLAHTIKVVSKGIPRDKIISGKVGSTHTIYRPDAGDPGTTTIDGSVWQGYSAAGVIWATIRTDAGNTKDTTTADFILTYASTHNVTSDQWTNLVRAIFLFDTSDIPDGDTIDAATLSIKGTSKADTFTTPMAPDVDIYTSTPNTNTTLLVGDYAQVQGTSQTGSPITYANWSTIAYNDFTFNATGRGNISKTGVSKFGTRNQNYDVANVTPTWEGGKVANIYGNFADTAGTDSDPKLVVVHTAAAGAVSRRRMLIGIGQ